LKPQELKQRLNSVVIVMATPFTRSDEVDVEGLRENTRFLVEKCAGKPAILVPTGSTGEFYTLTDEERRLVIKTVVNEVNGKVPVVAGTAQAGTRSTVLGSRYAQDVGADGVMVVLPYYHVPSETGMYEHYRTVAEALDVGVIIYNNPDTSKVYIKPELMSRLADVLGIIGDKENTSNLMAFYRMMKLVRPKMPVLCGLGEFWFHLEALLGCSGFISMIANYAPDISLELLSAAERKDFKAAQAVINRLGPLYDFENKVAAAHGPSTTILPWGMTGSYEWLAIMKEAMNQVGLHGGIPRLPIQPLTGKEREELSKVLGQIGVKGA